MKTGHGPLDRGKTNPGDMPLFRKLGLQPFDVETHDIHFVGEVKLEKGASVKISVLCMPSQFWTFEVTSVEGSTMTVTTGSGMLTAYWHSIYLMAHGMIVVETAATIVASKA